MYDGLDSRHLSCGSESDLLDKLLAQQWNFEYLHIFYESYNIRYLQKYVQFIVEIDKI